MIDIHCHLLPGIDDGPSGAEASLALARALVADGVTTVVCTPHVFPGRYENTRSTIARAQARFAALVEAAGIALTLRWAGEARLTPEILDLLAQGDLPYLGQQGDWRHLLLEMPDGQVPLGAAAFVRRLLAAKVRPVIVHPERNRGLMETPDRLREFIDLGCRVQITAGSLVGQFGPRAQAVAVEYVDKGWVHAVASDAHNLGGRQPRMRAAAAWLAQHGGTELAQRLTVDGPAGLIANNATVNAAAGTA